MSGTQYIALSGLRARMDELDRLAGDISNVGTSGYKGVRETRAAAERPSFDQTLDTAIDTTFGGAKNDMTSGSIANTGRPLDVAIDGGGFFAVGTGNSVAYTRNGHFSLNSQRQLVDSDGDLVQGASGGAITIGDGDVRVDEDGTVWAGNTKAGQLAVVTFPDPGALSRLEGAKFGANGQIPTPVTDPVVHGGALEDSNVSVSERLAELTTVARGFEALQKAMSMVLNDVDARAIDRLGRQ
jgi:flagellar basal body rod protein FlgG